MNLKFASHRRTYIVIFGWVGAGFRDGGLLAIIVGEPAPTKLCFSFIFDNPCLGYFTLFVGGMQDWQRIL